MKIGFLGLGKMGSGMVKRLCDSGHEVVGFDPYLQKENIVNIKSGLSIAQNLNNLVDSLGSEARVCIWLMLPAGDITDSTVLDLTNILPKSSIIVDGGNSNYKRSCKNYELCKSKEISFIDVGTSGGVWGQENGFCMMVGGDESSFLVIEPLLKSFSGKNNKDVHSYSYLGQSGSGHYAKMIHNAIEYALMQSYGEGLDLLKNGPYDYDLKKVLSLWNNGSVIRSWLLELGELMFEQDKNLDNLVGEIADSGTGKWSIEEALDRSIPIPVITASLFNRYRSRRSNSISDRFIAGLRRAFGGHATVKKTPNPQ